MQAGGKKNVPVSNPHLVRGWAIDGKERKRVRKGESAVIRSFTQKEAARGGEKGVGLEVQGRKIDRQYMHQVREGGEGTVNGLRLRNFQGSWTAKRESSSISRMGKREGQGLGWGSPREIIQL